MRKCLETNAAKLGEWSVTCWLLWLIHGSRVGDIPESASPEIKWKVSHMVDGRSRLNIRIDSVECAARKIDLGTCNNAVISLARYLLAYFLHTDICCRHYANLTFCQ